MAENRASRAAPLADFADDQEVRRDTHGVVDAIRQGNGRHFGADGLGAGFEGLDGLAVDPDFLRVFDLDDAPAFGQEVAHGREHGGLAGARPAANQDALAELHGLL